MLSLDSNKSRRWYRDVLSGFLGKGEESIHENDIVHVNEGTGEEKKILVPICIPKNMGEDMCIDEKMIGEEFYTILTNRITGKIALMANTTSSYELVPACIRIKKELESVRVINRDLASSYRRFSNIMMPNAAQIADNFHVVKLLLEAQQEVRIAQKRELNTRKREAYQAFKEDESTRKEDCKKKKLVYKRLKFEYKEKVLPNGETLSQILKRSRYLLYKFPNQWSDKQELRARLLFLEFPSLEKAYNLSIQFRNWYSKKNIGKHELILEKELYQWYEDVEISGITELMNFSSTVERNQDAILNYFYNNGASNAIAENKNGKIKKFISSNQGTRDKDFFFFRLKIYFA